MNWKELFKKWWFWIIVIVLINEFRFLIWGGFGLPPKWSSPNCGPEHRFKFDVTINSKEDVINFLKEYDGKIHDKYGNSILELDHFNVEFSREEVNWEKVESSVKISINGALLFYKKVYTLNYYEPFRCQAHKQTLKVTNDGYVSIYRCCGF